MAEKDRTKTRLEEDRIALSIVGMHETGKNRLVFNLFSVEWMINIQPVSADIILGIN